MTRQTPLILDATEMNNAGSSSSFGLWRASTASIDPGYTDVALLDRAGPHPRGGRLRRAVPRRRASASRRVRRAGPTRPSATAACRCRSTTRCSLVPAMAAVTRAPRLRRDRVDLTYEPPYLFARRMSTLDHLTDGRIGWNIVTAHLDSAARNLGLAAQTRTTSATTSPTSTWRSSTSSGRAAGRTTPCCATARPASSPTRPRCTRSRTTAPHFRSPRLPPVRAVAAAHAGALPGRRLGTAGSEFAARHAEAVFFAGNTPQLVRRWTDVVRAELGRAGTGRGLREDLRHGHRGGRRAPTTRPRPGSTDIAGTWTSRGRCPCSAAGPASTWPGRTPTRRSSTWPPTPTSPRSRVHAAVPGPDLDGAGPGRVRGIGGRGPVIAGAPGTVADELERWREEAGVDGFNISAAVRPADLERFTTMVSPELRRRGLCRSPGPARGRTLREAADRRRPEAGRRPSGEPLPRRLRRRALVRAEDTLLV